MTVSRETKARLEKYCDLVRKWNPHVNLIARSTIDDLWTRHIEDSVQLLSAKTNTSSWVDLGSGGGFPGLVIASCLKEKEPTTHVTLVESDKRKAVFLRSVVRELDLQATIKSERIESLEPMHATTLSARALAPLNTLLGYADRHLGKNGHALFPKGTNWQKEIDLACQEWSFTYHQIRSRTDEAASILVISDVKKL